MPPKPKHPGRGGSKLSLAGVSLDDALRAALKVKLTDVQKLERKEVSDRKPRRRKQAG
jgi:hypothetical protein